MARFPRHVFRFPVFPIWMVIALAACAAQGQDDSDQRIRDAADALLQDLHDRGLFNGAVVLGRAGEEVYARGFGPANVEAGVPFTPDTPADGGSIAKTFAAASILMLQDEGRLSLDDAVRVRSSTSWKAGPPERSIDPAMPNSTPRTSTRSRVRIRSLRSER